MKSKEAQEFTEYYRRKNVTGTYDVQREGNRYRKNKREKELGIFLNFLDKKSGEKVLELGCSSGFLTKHLGEVTAIDTSTGMLEVAHSKNPKARCLSGDMFKMDFEDNSFDKIITMRVWNHLDQTDFERALKEVKRVLKPNGIFVFDMEDRSWLRVFVSFFYKRIFRTTGFKIYQYSLGELKKTLASAGFKIEKIGFLRHRIGRQIVMRTRLFNED
jgi:ubiquinone/menaquinone biosynthesis C-methylase UbiE